MLELRRLHPRGVSAGCVMSLGGGVLSRCRRRPRCIGSWCLNDTHGHSAGDAALVETADRLRAWCGRNGTTGRLGGDEFVAVVRKLTAADLGALTAALHRPLHYNGTSLPLAASVGACALADLPVPALTDALAAADAAMYAAKGRSRRGTRASR